jgi:hypothetical protein
VGLEDNVDSIEAALAGGVLQTIKVAHFRLAYSRQ